MNENGKENTGHDNMNHTFRSRAVRLDELLNNAWIGQSGNITKRLNVNALPILGDLAEDTAHDFATTGLGQASRSEVDDIRRGHRANELAHFSCQ